MHKKFLFITISIIAFLGLMISSQAIAAVCNVPSGSYPTIQSAVNDATCDPINVAAGTYNETINIDSRSNLSIIGADKTTTIVKSSTTLPWNACGHTTGRQAVVRVVSSTNINISNLTLDFDLVKANLVHGVFYCDSTGTLDNNILKNMSVSDASGGYYEITSYVNAPSYTDISRAQVSFTNNTFIETGRLGIVTHRYVNSNISGNTFYKTTDDFGYAMEIGSQSTATVSNNTIYGYDTPAASDGSQSAGIYIENCFTGPPFGGPGPHVTKNVTASNNEVYDCQWALYVGNEFDDYSGDVDIVLTATSNYLHDNIDGAVVLTDEDKEHGSSVKATFNGNTISNNGGYGVYIYTQGDGDITAYLPDDTITGHDTGVYLDDTATGPSGSSYNVKANMNNISGNTSYGINNDYSGTTIDAELNWWGSSSGPTHSGNPGGTGDAVSDNVKYRPWLVVWPLPWYWKDYNGADPGGYMPDIDQNQDFDNVQARTEEDGAGVSFLGSWTRWPSPPGDPTKASGGYLKYSNDLVTPASCSFTFHGTSIRWIGFRQNNMGISEVWIDGQLDTTVDLYNPVSQWKQVLYTNNNLSHGQHTITIKPTNQKNPLSTGFYTGVDAFDVDDIEKHYCAPVAEANSLWWLNKKDPTLEIFGDPYTGTGYIGGDINGDGNADILDLVQELAIFKKTNVGHTGTTVEDEQAGIDEFLRKYGLDDKLYEHTVWDKDFPMWQPFFFYLEEEVERCQDVKLDLGFWHIQKPSPEIPACDGVPGNGTIWWMRVGGHAVTVAGVDSQNFLLAISDPDNDAAESGGLGVIRPVLGGHPLHPNDPSVHNNEANASHDIYTVGPSPSPGGKMGLLNYPGKFNFPEEEWVGPSPTPWPIWFTRCEESMIITEIEAAVIVSPPVCGNQIIEPGETCDPPGLPGPNPLQPGNCRLSCTYCGDGIQNNAEQCDDGDGINGNGCENDCTITPPPPICGDGIIGNTPGETCDPPGQPGPGPQPGICRGNCTYCGDDGILPDPGEQCDDGNGINNDACRNNCMLPRCGDAILDPGEQCDDGNNLPGDGCSPICLLEVCGNGILDPGEQCDDGNNISGDGCSAVCVIEFCGDGIVNNSPNEECDDGNIVSEDGCSATCQLEVVVTQPNGGEVVPSGSVYAIKWLALPAVKKFDLAYSLNNGGTWVSIASKVPGSSYNWTVPKPTKNKKNCLVKVIGYDASNVLVDDDTSNATFTIEVVKVTSPNGGENWKVGSTHAITWTTNGTKKPIAKVKLFYTTGGGIWNFIATVIGNPGTYNWKVPAAASATCKVKVVLKSAFGTTMGTDMSDAVFTISP